MKVEQCRTAQPVVKPKAFGQVADVSARFGVTGGLASNARFATGGLHQAEQNLDGRRLAGAVWPQEAKHLTGLNREVQPVKRYLAAVLLAEADRLNGGCQWTRGCLQRA